MHASRVQRQLMTRAATLTHSQKFPESMTKDQHITHFQVINCPATSRIVTHREDKGNVVVINCDNQPAMDHGAMARAMAKDPVLLTCTRAICFRSASNRVTYEFNHNPGNLMTVQDVFSRNMIICKFRKLADKFINDLCVFTC